MDRKFWTSILIVIRRAADELGWNGGRRRPVYANWLIVASERTSKRRRGFPSETHVERGVRLVHGEKELIEKLGRNDPCPCGSNKCF